MGSPFTPSHFVSCEASASVASPVWSPRRVGASSDHRDVFVFLSDRFFALALSCFQVVLCVYLLQVAYPLPFPAVRLSGE